MSALQKVMLGPDVPRFGKRMLRRRIQASSPPSGASTTQLTQRIASVWVISRSRGCRGEALALWIACFLERAALCGTECTVHDDRPSSLLGVCTIELQVKRRASPKFKCCTAQSRSIHSSLARLADVLSSKCNGVALWFLGSRQSLGSLETCIRVQRSSYYSLLRVPDRHHTRSDQSNNKYIAIL